MTINQILLQIANTTSTKNKVAIIAENKDNDLLKKVFIAAYDKSNYFMEKVPCPNTFHSKISLNHAMGILLPALSAREISGNKAIDRTYHILKSLSEDDSSVLSQILRKDLDIGLDTKLINKAYGETVIIHQDDRGYGLAQDYVTAQPVSVGFKEVQGEMLCYIPISPSGENGIHVKE